MKFKLFATLALFSVLNFANAKPASEASVEKMFQLTDMNVLLDQTYAQIDGMMQQQFTQMNIPEKHQPIMEKYGKNMATLIREELSWEKIKDPIIQAYAQTFTEEEVQELIVFYKTPIGQKMLKKMPQLMQSTMQLVQQSMATIQPKMMSLIQEMQAEIQAAN